MRRGETATGVSESLRVHSVQLGVVKELDGDEITFHGGILTGSLLVRGLSGTATLLSVLKDMRFEVLHMGLFIFMVLHLAGRHPKQEKSPCAKILMDHHLCAQRNTHS